MLCVCLSVRLSNPALYYCGANIYCRQSHLRFLFIPLEQRCCCGLQQAGSSEPSITHTSGCCFNSFALFSSPCCANRHRCQYRAPAAQQDQPPQRGLARDQQESALDQALQQVAVRDQQGASQTTPGNSDSSETADRTRSGIPSMLNHSSLPPSAYTTASQPAPTVAAQNDTLFLDFDNQTMEREANLTLGELTRTSEEAEAGERWSSAREFGYMMLGIGICLVLVVGAVFAYRCYRAKRAAPTARGAQASPQADTGRATVSTGMPRQGHSSQQPNTTGEGQLPAMLDTVPGRQLPAMLDTVVVPGRPPVLTDSVMLEFIMQEILADQQPAHPIQPSNIMHSDMPPTENVVLPSYSEVIRHYDDPNNNPPKYESSSEQ